MSVFHQPRFCEIYVRKAYDCIIVGYRQPYAPVGDVEIRTFALGEFNEAVLFANKKVQEGYQGIRVSSFASEEEQYKDASKSVLKLLAVMREFGVSARVRKEGNNVLIGIFKTYDEVARFIDAAGSIPEYRFPDCPKDDLIEPPRYPGRLSEKAAEVWREECDREAKFYVSMRFNSKDPIFLNIT